MPAACGEAPIRVIAAARRSLGRSRIRSLGRSRIRSFGRSRIRSFAYVWVAGRDELRAAMLDRVMGEVPLEPPEPQRWREQVHALMDETLAALLRYPGIARVGLGDIPAGGAALRIREAMLSVLLSGRIDPQGAGLAIDALPLLALATALETGRYAERGTDLKLERERIDRAYADLSPNEFLATAANLAGTRADRYLDAIDTFLASLTTRPSPASRPA
jgi:tetracycline repressor-like protein